MNTPETRNKAGRKESNKSNVTSQQHIKKKMAPVAVVEIPDETEDVPKPKPPTWSRALTALKPLLRSEEWWAVWVGFAFLVGIWIIVQVYHLVAPSLLPWDTRFWMAYDTRHVLIGLPLLFGAMVLSCAVALFFTNPGSFHARWILGLVFMWVLGLCSKTISAQKLMHKVGFGDAIWAIVIGMVFSNTVWSVRRATTENATSNLPKWLSPVVKPEFYIKISVVLLLTDFSEIGRLGLRGFLVATCDTVFIIVLMYQVGTRLLKMSDTETIVMVGGATICGSSAVTAIVSAIGAPTATGQLAIAIMSIFTVPQIPLLPFLSKAFALDFNDQTAGAWIGGSVDSTGAVIASATIRNGPTVSTAAVVKMIQNTLIGPIILVITAIWLRKKAAVEEPKESDPLLAPLIKQKTESAETTPEPKKSVCTRIGDSLLVLWDRFPRFVLGFLISSIILSLAVAPSARQNTKDFAFFVSEWFSAIGFVGIGLELDIMRFIPKLRGKGGRVILLYVLTQALDLVLTAVVAYLAFTVYGDKPEETVSSVSAKH